MKNFKLLFILSIALSVAASAQTPLEKTYLTAGQTFFQNGELDKAVAEFDKAIKLNPNSVEAFYFRGTIKFLKQDVDGAIYDFNKAIEFDPTGAASYLRRGTIYGLKGNWALTIADLKNGIKLEAQTRDAYEGTIQVALGDLNKYIAQNPANARGYAVRGFLRQLQGKTAEADADFNKSFELDPKLKIELEKFIKEAKPAQK